MTFGQDLRYAVRTLRNSPGFAVTAILTMALGIGITTAIFSVCDAMLWKPVPLPHLDTLAIIHQAVPGEPNEWNEATPADLDDIRRDNRSLQNFATWSGGLANLSGSGEPERVLQTLVSSNFFEIVGVHPARGRAFESGEDQPGREREVILSDGLWRRRFAADPKIVGRPIHIDDQAYTVIGVMSPSFDFPLATEIWTPLALTPDQRNSRRSQTLEAMGRLKPGRSLNQAAADIDSIAARLEKMYPETNKNRRFAVWPALNYLVDHETQQYLMMLLGSVVFVLLIACVNVANLQFARATGRLREVALRRALGAARSRVIVQLVVESILLSSAGALCGLLVAKWGLNAIHAGMPAEIERYVLGFKDIRLDSRALLFTLGAAVASGIIAGLAPAWQCSQPNLMNALKEGGRSSSSGKGRQRLGSMLVAAEIALAVMLLIGAGLMVRGFRALIQNGQSLEPATLLTLRLAITDQKYHETYQQAEFYRQVIEHIRAIPGVRSAAAVTALPYSAHSSGRAFVIEGRQVEPGNQPTGRYQVTTPDYFAMLHIPLRQGRLFTDRDGRESQKVALISERLAQRWWKNESPLGRHIQIASLKESSPWLTVVGIVADVIHDPYNRFPSPTIYVPYQQAPSLWMDVGVRTSGDPLAVAPAVTAAVRSVDRAQPITEMHSMEKSIHDRAIGLNYVATLMGVFGGVALLLSAVGVYGVMAYLVSERTQEIGVRIALGAPRANVLQMIFRRGLFTALAGLVIGLPLAYLLARLMASLIYGVTATDPTTFIGIPVVLLAAAALAIYLPARRAMSIDPIIALRCE